MSTRRDKPATKHTKSFVDERGQARKNLRQSQTGPRGGDRDQSGNGNSDWQEKVIQVSRVTKVVKGGKNLSFRCLVVIGDLRGNLGVGLGKASEVVDAVRKAIEDAKKNVIRLPFDQGSIPHNVEGRSNSSRVSLFKAPKGTGLIAPWMVKVSLELAGLHNVVCKVHGSTNPANVLLALQDAVRNLRTKGQIRQVRGGSNSSLVV